MLEQLSGPAAALLASFEAAQLYEGALTMLAATCVVSREYLQRARRHFQNLVASIAHHHYGQAPSTDSRAGERFPTLLFGILGFGASNTFGTAPGPRCLQLAPTILAAISRHCDLDQGASHNQIRTYIRRAVR